MNELLGLAGAVLVGASGFAGLFTNRRSRRGEVSALVLLAIGSFVAMAGAARCLSGHAEASLVPELELPVGSFRVSMDALSAFFLVQINLISFLGAVYGLSYWPQSEHPADGRKLRLFYGLASFGMAIVALSANALTFLIGWETMALGAFFALTSVDTDLEVREAGYLYLVATRLSTMLLVALFAILSLLTGGFELSGSLSADGPLATAAFLLALVGFGVKAGLMPLHVWLPGAHANAPSHVSSLMSGVLIKMGIFGLLRVLSMFPHPPAWWGLSIAGLGAVSGVLGVAFAIGQHDLKRLLAYHSVENIGIIAMGLGLALLGRTLNEPSLFVLGLSGCLLHTWNHGLFKSLLFLAAGAVLHETGTREIDRLGGLAKVMPRTAVFFLVGSVAICGLPPLNGFVSELFVYLAMFETLMSRSATSWIAAALLAAALAFIGSLAVACFVKVFGATFLGEPRTDAAKLAHEPARSMLIPMGVLAVLCFWIGLGSPWVSPILDRATAAFAPELSNLSPVRVLAPIDWVSVLGVSLVLGLVLIGLWMRRHFPAPTVGTWDCGYSAPTARMQYSSSSFAQILVGLFAFALRPRSHGPGTLSLFPGPSKFESHVPDTVLDEWLLPASRAVGRASTWLRSIQRGNIHAYLVYILATLFVLMIWSRM